MKGGRRCTAHNRQGGRCGRAAVVGGDVCRLHGGASPKGAAHPSWRHGRYSRYVPRKLATTFARALVDPDLLALDKDLALLEVRIDGLLHAVGGGASAETADAWEHIEAALELRGKLVTREISRQVLMRAMIPSAQAFSLATLLVQAIETECPDRQQFARIADRFAVLLGPFRSAPAELEGAEVRP